MTKVCLKPRNNYLSLKMIVPEEPDQGVIIMPDLVRKEPRWGHVMETGPGVVDMRGELTERIAHQGDLVYTTAHGRELVRLGVGENTHVVSELDVLGKMEDLETMRFQPFGDLIQIKKKEHKEDLSEIILPDDRRLPPGVGTVVKLGLGWRSYDGYDVPMQVKEGQNIAFDPWKVLVIDLSDLGVEEKLYLVSHGDIYGILEDEE